MGCPVAIHDVHSHRRPTRETAVATTTTHTCDRCKSTIEAGRTLIRVECGAARTRLESADLCPTCSDAFLEFLGECQAKPDEAETGAD
jgi:hypothetical protein